MKTFSSKLFFMLFIIGMIGISSCTEQDVSTLKSPDAQVELRSLSGPCGDAPYDPNEIVITSTYTNVNGDCCITVKVNGIFPPNSTIRTAQSGILLTNYGPQIYYSSSVFGGTVTNNPLGATPTVIDICFPPSSAAKYLSVLIVGPTNQLLSCAQFVNPCF